MFTITCNASVVFSRFLFCFKSIFINIQREEAAETTMWQLGTAVEVPLLRHLWKTTQASCLILCQLGETRRETLEEETFIFLYSFVLTSI